MKMQSEFLIHLVGRCVTVLEFWEYALNISFAIFCVNAALTKKKNCVTVNSVKVDIIFLVKKDTSILYTLIFSFLTHFWLFLVFSQKRKNSIVLNFFLSFFSVW
jgi:hypothetical protein